MHHLSRSEHFRKYSAYLRVLLRFSEVSEHQDLGASHPPLALGLGLAHHQPEIGHPVDRAAVNAQKAGSTELPVRVV